MSDNPSEHIVIRLIMDRDDPLSDETIERYAETAARQARTWLGVDAESVAFDVHVPFDPDELGAGQLADAEYIDRVAEAAAQAVRTRLTAWRRVQLAGSRVR